MTVGMKFLGLTVLLGGVALNAAADDSSSKALTSECIAIMNTGKIRGGDAGALVSYYRQSTPDKRQACVDDLARALGRAPTYADSLPFLTKDRFGDYQLGKQPTPEITDRIYINGLGAQGIFELTEQNLVGDPKIIPPLIECADHPDPMIATSCALALSNLTRRGYRGDTSEWTQHRPFVDQWRAWWAVLEHGHPVFDQSLANECRATIREIFVRVARAQRAGNESPRPYLEDESSPYRADMNSPRLNLDSGWSGTLFAYDIGKDNTDYWPTKKTTRIGLVVRRDGNPNLDKQATAPSIGEDAALHPVLRERFPMLDLDVSFSIDTTDDQIRQATLAGVHEALGRLRELDAKARK